MTSNYSLALFFHFLGLAMLFVGYGLEWIVSRFLRGATTTDQVRAWLRVYRTSLPVSGPGLLVLILSGAYLAQVSGAMKNGWMSASMLAILFALGIGFVFILPRVKAIRASLPEGSMALPTSATALLRAPGLPTLIRVRAMLALGIVFLMTIKPSTFAYSLLILGAAMLLGLLAAIPAFSKSNPA
jgi:hypothetical protein